MRWPRFLILVLLTLVLQVGMGRVFGLGPARITPDLLFLLAVVLSFRGHKDEMLLACWILGLAKDLSSQVALGGYALSFGLAGLLVVQIRDFLYGERLLGQVMVFLLAYFLVEHTVWLISWARGDMAGMDYQGLLMGMLFSALLSAALYPYILWLIIKLEPFLGLSKKR
ncbi:MAG: rod shape-determining protein MreD [Sedimentisphaerales bacterium]|nr:rod shape-determining protein MreD [Sedimentisphaerales bacterium]